MAEIDFGDMSFSNGANDSVSGGYNFGGGSTGGGGFDWGNAISTGAQLFGGLFDYQSGRDSAAALGETYGQIATDARTDAGTASGMADPFQQYRGAAAGNLAGILSGEVDFRTDPGYKFRMDEGMREVERGASARGMNRSGNVMAAMGQRSQDIASSEYDKIITRLTGLAGGSPQNAIAGGQTYGNMMGNVYGAQIGATANNSQSGGSSGMGGLMDTVGGLF